MEHKFFQRWIVLYWSDTFDKWNYLVKRSAIDLIFFTSWRTSNTVPVWKSCSWQSTSDEHSKNILGLQNTEKQLMCGVIEMKDWKEM